MNNNDFTIIVDTREQQPWEFKEFLKSSTKLDTGDYSIEGMEHIVAIERKKTVSEFANNITESRFTDVIMRMGSIKYCYLLLEFNLEDVLIYPVGSNVPKKMLSKIRITPGFILKNLLDLELQHNIYVHFCGDADNAEKLAATILKKVYYIERNRN